MSLIVDTLRREMENQTKTKFNWIALLFNGGAYYAGYGSVKKGIIMSIIGFLPLTVILVNLYAGFKANQELPVKKKPFHWGKWFAVLVLHMAILSITFSLIQGFKSGGIADANANNTPTSVLEGYTDMEVISLFSGVWLIDETGEEVVVNLGVGQGFVQIDQTLIISQVSEVDQSNGIVHFIGGVNQAPMKLTQVMGGDGESFTLKLFLQEGNEYEMSFVRDLSAIGG